MEDGRTVCEHDIRGSGSSGAVGDAVDGSPVATRVCTPRHKRLMAPVAP